MRYFGADFDVDGLIRRLNNGNFVIPNFDPAVETSEGVAGFQRKFVWTKKQMDRFIESILLGYPVPGIFLVERPDRTYLVLDGQQRLRTLQLFYSGRYWQGEQERVFRLAAVGEKFKRLTYDGLGATEKNLFSNTFIQATVVVPKNHNMAGVYALFERINSGGTNLQSHEIRVALYSGVVINEIRELNHSPDWRELFSPKPHSRLKDNELILRHFALRPIAERLSKFGWDEEAAKSEFLLENGKDTAIPPNFYRPPMATFLNSYLAQHVELDEEVRSAANYFGLTCNLIVQQIGPRALKIRGGSQVNAAHTDALLTAISLNMERGTLIAIDDIGAAYSSLLEDDDYKKAISDSTSHKDMVLQRLKVAYLAFSDAQ
nr:DUF262 domain-containing protein [Kineosporia mesophila]